MVARSTTMCNSDNDTLEEIQKLGDVKSMWCGTVAGSLVNDQANEGN